MFGNGSKGEVRPHAIGLTILAMAISVICTSCAEPYPTVVNRGRLPQGDENRSSVSFAMNGRPVRLELLVRVEGSSVTVEIDHPDGRTTEAIEVAGPGIRELCKEYPKEPGSWELRMIAKGGAAAYWVALHDRRKYIGPDEDARRFVERE